MCLVAGCNCAVVGVGGGDLVKLRRFDYGLPGEGIDWMWVGGDAQHRCSVVVAGLRQSDGFSVFDEAEGPEGCHCEESGDGPALSPEGWFACAYFAADKAEEGWGYQGG